MPSKTLKQKRFMAAAAHDKSFAKRAGIKQSVAKEFNQADARKGARYDRIHTGSPKQYKKF
jgi:hypothetical protein